MGVEHLQQVRGFIETNFMFREGVDRLSETESLLETGLIDSTGILELVAFLEEHFGIRVEDEDLIPENFDSIAAIAAYLDRTLASQPAAD